LEKIESVKLPQIIDIDIPTKIMPGEKTLIQFKTQNSTMLYYFVSDSSGIEIAHGIIPIKSDVGEILLDSNTTKIMHNGGHDIKVYAVSDTVLKPDIYMTSFYVSDKPNDADDVEIISSSQNRIQNNYGIIISLIGTIIVGIIVYFRKSHRLSKH